MKKEPYGTMGPRFKVLITLGFVGSVFMATQSDAEPMALPMGLLCLVIFGVLYYLRASESSVDTTDSHRALKQLDSRRSVMWLVVVLLLPVAWFVLSGLADMSSGQRSSWP